jgi:uncharacterized protein YggE
LTYREYNTKSIDSKWLKAVLCIYMKESWAGTIIVFFVVLFVYTKLAGPIPFFINSVNTTKTDLFTSNGEGKVTAVPDQATVDAGVTAQSATVADAQNKVNQTTNKIIADLKKLGLSDKDIKTTDYSINPNYSSENVIMPMLQGGGQQTITGYTVTQNLEVKVKPIDKANKVVDTTTADGANLVGGINFTFSDDLQKSLSKQATQQAVDDAKNNAQTLADASGVHLGKIVNVVQNSNQPRPVMMSAGVASKSLDQSVPTNVTPGENSLTVDVVLYYETY